MTGGYAPESHIDQNPSRIGTARARRAGAPSAEPGAGERRTRRRSHRVRHG